MTGGELIAGFMGLGFLGGMIVAVIVKLVNGGSE